MSKQETASVTVYSDYVCPFCYLGRHSLRQYQERRDDELEIDWHPFDLRAGKRGPDGEIDQSAEDGKDDEYYEQAKENVRRLQERYDVEMTLDLATDVDSFDAQVASEYVKEEHPYEAWLEFDWGLFEALWTESRDVGDRDVIAEVARDAGLDDDEVLVAFEN
ncbi:DsbA family protein, partial [Halobium palmae]